MRSQSLSRVWALGLWAMIGSFGAPSAQSATVTGDCPDCYKPLYPSDPPSRPVSPQDALSSSDEILQQSAEDVHSLTFHGSVTRPGRPPIPIERRRSPPADQVTSVQITRDCRGRWQWTADGQPILMRQGAAYSPVPPGRHINDYLDHHELDRLFASLLPEEEAARIFRVNGLGADHGRQIRAAGFTAIRVYTAPIEDADEIDRFKQVMRRAFELYGIRVNLSDFLGFYDPDPGVRANGGLMKERVLKLAELYGNEPWLASFTLGNESDLYLNAPGYPSLSMSQEGYYKTMDWLADVMKHEAGVQRPILLGHGKPNTSQIPYLAALQHFDGVGFNLYGDTTTLHGDLALLQRINDERKLHDAPELPFVLNEFGQMWDWIQYVSEPAGGDRRRAEEFAKQIELLDQSPLIAARFAFELTDETWKGDPSQPGYEGSPYAARYGIL